MNGGNAAAASGTGGYARRRARAVSVRRRRFAAAMVLDQFMRGHIEAGLAFVNARFAANRAAAVA